MYAAHRRAAAKGVPEAEGLEGPAAGAREGNLTQLCQRGKAYLSTHQQYAAHVISSVSEESQGTLIVTTAPRSADQAPLFC